MSLVAGIMHYFLIDMKIGENKLDESPDAL
jgi:hypothetical protein